MTTKIEGIQRLQKLESENILGLKNIRSIPHRFWKAQYGQWRGMPFSFGVPCSRAKRYARSLRVHIIVQYHHFASLSSARQFFLFGIVQRLLASTSERP